MLEQFFFALGLANSLLLIAIFLIRKRRLDLVTRFGWVYFLLAAYAAFEIFLAVQERKSVQYSIFLCIFLVFLLVEWLLDRILKLDFRSNLRKNWKWAVPYLFLYYAMNYGFVVMPWKTSTAWGLTMLGLFIIQLATNLISHPKPD